MYLGKFFALVCFIAALAVYGQEFSLERALPERTLFWATLPDLEKVGPALAKTGMAQIAGDEEIVRFFAHVPGLSERIAEEAGEWRYLWRYPPRQVSVALVDMADAPGIVAAVEIGESESGEYVQLTIEDALSHFSAAPPGQISVTRVGDTLICSTSDELLQEILTPTPGAKMLADAEDYRRAKARVEGGRVPVAFAYFNVAQALSKAGEASEIPASFWEDTGLGEIESISLGITVDGRDIHAILCLSAPGESGLKRFLADKPLDRGEWRHAPPSSVGFSAANWDWQDKGKIVKAAIDRLGFAEECREAITSIEEKMGISVENLLPLLGDGYLNFSYFSAEGALFPHSISVCQVQKPQALLDYMRNRAHDMQWTVAEIPYRERVIYCCQCGVRPWGNPPTADIERMIDSPDRIGCVENGLKEVIALAGSGSAFFIEGGTVYQARSVQVLKDFIDDRPSWHGDFSQSPQWSACSDLVPADAHFVLFRDYRRTFSVLWETSLSAAVWCRQSLEEELGFPLPLEFVPRGSCLARYFPVVLLFGVADQRGISWELYLRNIGTR